MTHPTKLTLRLDSGVIERVVQGLVTGMLSATTLTTIAYLAGKTVGKRQAIITRNLKDFAHSPVRAYTARQWLAMGPV